MLFQELFHDENFCLKKGFCLGNSHSGSLESAGQTQILRIGETLKDALGKLHEGMPVDMTTIIFNNTSDFNHPNAIVEVRRNSKYLNFYFIL